jgi:ribosomal protein S18 acetylase RimI-like enzyme
MEQRIGGFIVAANHEQAGRLEIMPATEAQVEQIAPLFDAYRQFYHQPSDVGRAVDFLRQRLSRGESVVLLAQLHTGSEASAVGFAQLYPSFDSIALKPAWILYDLFVAPEARRLGVGRALLRASRALGERTSASELTLQTAIDNLPAQALYASEGWQRDDVYYTYLLTL